MKFENSESFAQALDDQDPMKKYRDQFLIPKAKDGNDILYFAGNSLGLQPKKAREFIGEELDDWARFGVEGHLHARHPWLPYHENLTAQTARLVGAKPLEVVVMNTLTVNLNLMMVSFYQPTKERYKILMEAGAFPSDQYAVSQQVKFHSKNVGFDPSTAIIELKPRTGESTLRTEDILTTLEKEGSQIALVMFGSVNYLTGQAFDIPAITQASHAQGCFVGFDFAHGVGNLHLKLNEWGPDFAVWCSYKYLNAGPGALSGCFVHERHANNKTLPRFAGWWGHDKTTRFQMGPNFNPIPGAEGWQMSNPPIFQLAALRASMDLFDEATIPKLREKGDLLTGYLEFLIDLLPKGFCEIKTPRDVKQRGSQLSLKFQGDCKALLKDWNEEGIIADFREPDVIRIAPTAMYNRFSDVYHFVKALSKYAK